MYLMDGLYDPDNRFYEMSGIFPFTAVMKQRRASLGYREIRLLTDTIVGIEGETLRGHEFHYSEIDDTKGAVSVYEGAMGFHTQKNCLGSYVHLHFAGCKGTVSRLVCAMQAGEACSRLSCLGGESVRAGGLCHPSHGGGLEG